MIQWRFKKALQQIFYFDLRSIALFRISFGCFLFCDLISRSLYFREFYTDEGILPSSWIRQKLNESLSFSIHHLSGEPLFIGILLFISLLAAFFLIIGFKTRLSTLVSFLLLSSLTYRNSFVTDGGNHFLCIGLFWGLFLPLGSCYSIDAKMKGSEQRSTYQFISYGSIGFLLQVVLIYFTTAFVKSKEVWWVEGSALYYALHWHNFASFIGEKIRGLPELLKLLTRSAYLFELLLPLALFIPLKAQRQRFVSIIGLGLFHLGTALVFRLDFFPFICISFHLAFLPSSFWQKSEVETIDTRDLSIRFPAQLMALVFLCYFLTLNLKNYFPRFYENNIPEGLAHLSKAFSVKQEWFFFAPSPRVENGWMVMMGESEDAREIDIYRGEEEISFKRNKVLPALYKAHKWQTYIQSLQFEEESEQLPFFSSYLCRSWKKDKLKKVRIYFMDTPIILNYEQSTPVKRLLIDHSCY